MATTCGEFALVAEGRRTTPVTGEEAVRIVNGFREVCAENEGRVLTSVDLSCRTYREDGVAMIAAFLTPELVKNVTTFKGDDMIAGIKEESALRILKSICDIFLACPLEIVNLSDNALGNKGLTACDSVLGQQNGLKELYLLNNGLATESMEVLEQQLAGSKELHTIRFENNMVGQVGARNFANIVRTCPKLRDIMYSQVRAGTAGSLAVCEALAENTNLRLVKLNISGGKLFSDSEQDGREAICKVLRRSPELIELDISDSELTDEGMDQVSEAILDGNASLEKLNVSENELTPACCELLANVLRQNRATLQVFQAYTNELTSEGVEILMAVYDSDDAALQVVNLNENELGHRAAVALSRVTLPAIRTVKLSGNGFVLRDVTRLENRFGDVLEELEDNDSDAEYDGELDDEEDEQVEEQVDEVNAAPQEQEDILASLTEQLGKQHL